MGGSLTYEYIGPSGGTTQYHVTLKIYRYCDATGGGTATLDPSMMLGVYPQDPANPNADKIWLQTDIMPVTSQQFITPPNPGSNCSFSTTVCVEEGIYEADILLPPSNGGYHLMVERCCRNGNIVNLSNPGGIGMTYYAFIPPDPIINSSPVFSDVPVPFICTGDTITIVNNAVDPDGDVLVYSFETPYIGYSGTTTAVPDPQFDNNPYVFPIPTTLYNAGYSVAQPFGAAGYTFIDSNTGLTSYYLPNQGFFVVAIEIKEYRNGVLIASIRRDLQLIAIPCPPNTPPVLSTANGSGITNYTITEGQTLCFPITFTDANGDSIFFSFTGNIFNGAVVNPPAVLSTPNDDGIVIAQFCWSTDCGQAQAAPYQFVVTALDNGCPPKETNQVYSITVNPTIIPPAPAISIAANPAGPICSGTSVTFTATPTFGGTSPVFQWQLNGVNVGTNSVTYTSSTLNDGDVVTCTLTSNSVCVTTFVANSNPIVITVSPFVAPSVTINAVPAGPVCSGTNVTFTAIPVNPGPTPTYQWQVNGINVGTNSPTYSSSTLTMGNVVSVSLTANVACPSATSNSINMTVNPTLTPSVSITASPAGSICPGASVTFTAVPTNGGSAPSYQWQVNGISVGINSNSFTSTTLNNGDVVQVILTSNYICLSSPTGTSNNIVMAVNAPSNPSVSISANPAGAICAGTNVIFTAVPVLGGTAPSYQWKRNGVNVGTNSSVFSTSALANGDVITVVMTSNSTCVISPTANSNQIVMVVDPIINPAVSIVNNPVFPVCSGTAVTFTATPVNGGTSPSYQWQLNGVNVGVNSPSYTTTLLASGNTVRVILTSNARCVSPTTKTSNTITASITPLVTPAISISANPAGPICDGTSVTFTAVPTNGGATPDYQWQINGANFGTNSNTFTSSTLSNNNQVRVILTSNANCAVPVNATSNVIAMTVNPILTPDVSIAAVPSTPICDGTNVTFTAAPINGGAAPFYLWRVNGVSVGTNSDTYSSISLNNSDIVTVILTSNALCVVPAKDTSNAIPMTVWPIVTPAVTVVPVPAGAICDGTNVAFTANVINGGPAPSYQWTLNGINVGANQNTYSNNLLQDNDTIQVSIVSNENCLTTPSAYSNVIMTVNPLLTPLVTITSTSDTICPNDNVIFTATPVNGGAAPAYQWTVNGVPAGTNSNIFSASALLNNDKVRVLLTSNAICATPVTALSNVKTIIVNPNLSPNINITANINTVICDGTPMIYTSVISNGGTVPHYQWRINGLPVGTDTSVFISTTIADGDQVSVVLTSSATCVLPPTDTSNIITTLVDQILTPAITISANPPGTFCDGAIITYSSVIANGGSAPAYQWQVNGSNISYTTPSFTTDLMQDNDTLTCILNSNYHCPSVNPVTSNQVIIDRLPPLVPVITGTDAICYGKVADMLVTATGGNGGAYYYTWDNDLSNDSVFVLSPPVTTTYTVTVNDSCSTPRNDSFTITVYELPVTGFEISPAEATILNPFFDFVNITTNASQWAWNFGDTTYSDVQFPQHTYLHPGYFTVQLIATSSDGCVDSISHELFVEESTTIYFPNTFTPNDDGKNDFFGPIGNAIPPFEMTIWDRTGQKVFYTDKTLNPWKGEMQASTTKAPQGVYVYGVTFKGDYYGTLKKKIYHGQVTLIR